MRRQTFVNWWLSLSALGLAAAWTWFVWTILHTNGTFVIALLAWIGLGFLVLWEA